MEELEWSRSISRGRSGGPSQHALMHAGKLGHEISLRVQEMVGIHPKKMSPELRAFFIHSGGLELLSSGRRGPHFRRMMEDFRF
jgi:hypothetical protein